MNEMNVDWNDLKIFLVVAQEGGLSAASKRLTSSPATIGRRMVSLEASLNCELFLRHDRGYSLLPAGEALRKKLQSVERDILAATGKPDESPLPLVKVSAGTWTTLRLMQNLQLITGVIPEIRLRFLVSERILDITHRETVIGIRNERPTEEALVCRKLSPVTFSIYRKPNAPEHWIKVNAQTPSAQWLESKIGDGCHYEVSNPRSSLDLALAGKGLVVLPDFIGRQFPQLARQSEVIDTLTHEQWLVVHQQERARKEVRSVIDKITQCLLS